jgi:hypothetical protein
VTFRDAGMARTVSSGVRLSKMDFDGVTAKD